MSTAALIATEPTIVLTLTLTEAAHLDGILQNVAALTDDGDETPAEAIHESLRVVLDDVEDRPEFVYDFDGGVLRNTTPAEENDNDNENGV